MEAYAIYLMIVAGSHLDILEMRLQKLGHNMTHDQIQINNLDLNLVEKSFRVDYLEAYAKIAR